MVLNRMLMAMAMVPTSRKSADRFPRCTLESHNHLIVISGTAAGNQFGVAKSANLIAVKVLDDNG